MAQHIGKTTGEGRTSQWGVRGTDLGYLTRTNHGYVLGTFGDTFSTPMPSREGWRSPVILRTHNADLDSGIRWDNAVGGAQARQAVEYARQSKADALVREAGGYTQIPNDVIHLPDGRYIMSAFVVRSWDRHGPASWLTWSNRFYVSTETHAEHWAPAKNRDTGMGQVTLPNWGEWSKFQNASFVLVGDYLYMFGTQSGRYDDGGIYLARVRWEDWDRPSRWERWGWTGSEWRWGTAHASPILGPSRAGAPIGEVNARVIEGQVVLTYMDYGVGATVTRTAVAPDSVWTAPQAHVTAAELPRLYAPALHPYSTLERAYAHVSQWTDAYYGCHLHRLAPLASAAPIAPAEGLEGTNTEPAADLTKLDAEDLAAILTSETDVTAEELLEAMRGRR